MKKLFLLLLVISACGCSETVPVQPGGTGTIPDNYSGTTFTADYTVANEAVLRAIPAEYIDRARTNLHIAYQHTSHGTHVAYGVFGLPAYKSGDAEKFGVCTPGSYTPSQLEFHDYAMGSYAASGEDASDLSRNETAFIQATRNYLNDAKNSRINVVMWSWCDISGHDVAGNYLPGIATLVNEFGPGGSTARAQTNPVHFILMTGHANAGANIGDGKPKNQAALINSFSSSNRLFCLDYHSIDTHAMDGTCYDDAGDNGQSAAYGGNFLEDWQNNHTLNTDWYNNLNSVNGSTTFGNHNTQHITANRKAYAFWWILARISGWDGTLQL